MPRPSESPVSVPGEITTDATTDTSTAGDTYASDELAALRAQLAAKDAEIAALQAQAAAPAPESIVTTPVTPHGAQRLAESEFRNMTVAQAQKALAAGEITLGGRPSVLCADGYFCDPSYR